MNQKLIHFCLFTMCIIGQTYSQTIQLGEYGMNPKSLVDLNGTLFFKSGKDPLNQQLWKSSGTVASTVLVKNIKMGLDNSNYAKLNNKLFFPADDGIHGYELWMSDGTDNGTIMVKDINQGNGISYPTELTEVNGELFFSASSGNSNEELWKSDGTESGTVMVKDINPGANFSAPQELANINGTLFFRANDGTHGIELWKSNGTEAGTLLVKDINPGTGSSYPTQIVNKNGIAYFFANDGTNGFVLWKSDGTEAGTVIVKNINVLDSYSTISYLKNVNGILFFSGTDGTNGSELWKSDGTATGTTLVKDIWPGTSSSGPTYLDQSNDTLFFTANDGAHGVELWKSDGSPTGTVLVKDIYNSSFYSNPHLFNDVDGVLYFVAGSPKGWDLWKSTSYETSLVYNLLPDSSSTIYDIEKSGNFVYFVADDLTNGSALWRYEIIKKDQIITFQPLNQKTYGNADFNLAATANSGFVINYVSSDPNVAMISGSKVKIVGAGSCNITASQKGYDLFKPATDVIQQLIVNKANLILTANDQVRTMGQPNPPFTISYTGFVNNESESVIDIKPEISCIATIESPVGIYDIVLTGGSDNNYNLTNRNGRLTINSLTAVKKLNKDMFKVFPVPTFDYIYVTSEQEFNTAKIKLYALTGDLLFSQNLIKSVNKLDLSNYSRGLYILKIFFDDEVIVKQVIKQ